MRRRERRGGRCRRLLLDPLALGNLNVKHKGSQTVLSCASVLSAVVRQRIHVHASVLVDFGLLWVCYVQVDLESELNTPGNLNLILRAPGMCSHSRFAQGVQENWMALGDDFVPLVPGSHSRVCPLEEYRNWILWEMTSSSVSCLVYMFGFTADTCTASVNGGLRALMEAFDKFHIISAWMRSRSCSSPS